jgi:hypothetical protein
MSPLHGCADSPLSPRGISSSLAPEKLMDPIWMVLHTLNYSMMA